MGIAGLHTYMENSACCKRINLRYRKTPSDQNRVIVVDGYGLYRRFTPASLDWVCGGQYYEMSCLVHNFVSAFTREGYTLHVVFDGCVEKAKTKEWLKRRKEDKKRVDKVIAYVKENNQPPPKQLQWSGPCTTATLISAFQAAGSKVFRSLGEADREISEYCTKHNYYGILAKDSDFLILDNTRYLVSSSVDINNTGIWVDCFERTEVLNFLNIDGKLAPLLSCVLGNDYISTVKLLSFHRKLLEVFGSSQLNLTDDWIRLAETQTKQLATLRTLERKIWALERQTHPEITTANSKLQGKIRTEKFREFISPDGDEQSNGAINRHELIEAALRFLRVRFKDVDLNDPDALSEKITSIAREIFPGSQFNRKLFAEALVQYKFDGSRSLKMNTMEKQTDFITKNIPNEVIERHWRSELDLMVLSALIYHRVNKSPVIADHDRTSPHVVCRPIRRHLYGLLFTPENSKNAKKNDNKPVVWIKETFFSSQLTESKKKVATDFYVDKFKLPHYLSLWKSSQKIKQKVFLVIMRSYSPVLSI